MGKGGGCGGSKATDPVDDVVKQSSKQQSEPVKQAPLDGLPDEAPEKTKAHRRKMGTNGGLELRAAMLIQRWYRRRKAQLKLRAACSWQVFTRMEFQSEQEQTGLHDFFADLSKLKEALEHERSEMTAAERRSRKMSGLSFLQSGAERKSLVGLNIGAAESIISPETEDLLFERPNKPADLTPEVMKELIKGCQDDQIISAELMMCILDDAFQTQKEYPNIRKMGTDVARQVTVVGDLHGQFQDLMVIFQKEGIPSATNPYIFNGDIVDRGDKSVELCAVILGFQLIYPHSVFINRGNHEDYLMNKRYGFENEVQMKYGSKASKLLRAFGAFFSALPFCTVIDDEILVVHGGISDESDLEVLETLQRQQFVSILRAAKSANGTSATDCDAAETSNVINAVWSDPGPLNGCIRNSQRGGGCVWGPDVTDAFLAKYDFRMIVRAHECCQEGHRWTHNRKVLTIFSASNYYARGSNLGAYAVFKYGQLDEPCVSTYDADPGAEEAHVTEQVGALEKAALKELLLKVYEKKDLLLEAFKSCDPDDLGMISVRDWARCMDKITALNVPWLLLRDDLIRLNDKSMLEYEPYIMNFKVEATKYAGVGVADKLYKNVGALEYIFKLIDVDNSGHVSHKEFVMACKTLNRYLGTKVVDDEAAFDMARAVDIDKNGSIEFNEFVESFRLIGSGNAV
eukprot:m.20523 g.20523  ORF g.20523 m.20523 type:complete len:686 (-) comp3800_c0_seq1:281-2338(-)